MGRTCGEAHGHASKEGSGCAVCAVVGRGRRDGGARLECRGMAAWARALVTRTTATARATPRRGCLAAQQPYNGIHAPAPAQAYKQCVPDALGRVVERRRQLRHRIERLQDGVHEAGVAQVGQAHATAARRRVAPRHDHGQVRQRAAHRRTRLRLLLLLLLLFLM